MIADYPQHALELVSRKCVRSLAAADNVLTAAYAALVERESNRFSIQLQPSSTKPKYICLSISISASSIRTIPGNRLVSGNSCLHLAQPMCRGRDCLTNTAGVLQGLFEAGTEIECNRLGG